MIRKYGLQLHKDEAYFLKGLNGMKLLSLPSTLLDEEQNDAKNSRRLSEMAHFLEIIRNLQCRLSAKFKKAGQGLVGYFFIFLQLMSLLVLHIIVKFEAMSLHFGSGGW